MYQVEESEQSEYNDMDVPLILSGNNVANEIFEGISEDTTKDWLFVPFNFRQDTRINLLEKALYDNFGRNMSNEDLQSIWENGNDSEREKVKLSFRSIKGSFNTNSMTLFSGEIEAEHFQYVMDIEKCSKKGLRACDKLPGCLYTGDYDASGKQKLDQLMNAYKMYRNDIGCIQIPHHGSRHNYNSELSTFDAYFIISASKTNRYKHPHAMVIKDLLYKRHYPYIVTEDENSIVQLMIEHL